MTEYLGSDIDCDKKEELQAAGSTQQNIGSSEIQQIEQRNGFHLFYIFPLLYLISIYLFPVFCVGAAEGAKALMYLPFICGVLNIIASVKFCKPENRIMMLNAAVLLKYAMIPFFLVGGLAVFAAFLMSFIPVPFMIFLTLPLATLGAAGGWLILAFESPYVLSYLHLASKEKLYSKGMGIVHTILQFFFTLDVIDVMILTFRERKWRKVTVFIIVMLAVVVILAVLCIILGIARAIPFTGIPVSEKYS